MPYNTTTQTIPNFTVVTVPTNQNGTYQPGTQTVTYYYKRNDAGNVIVNFVEQGTNTPLKSPVTMNGAGKLGLPYTTTPDTFANYELVSATPTNHTGNYPPAGK